MYQSRKSKRKKLRDAKSNPNAEWMGFESLSKYNDEHPDELHQQFLDRKRQEELAAKKLLLEKAEREEKHRKYKTRLLDRPKRGRGRAMGDAGTCSRCRYAGHNKSTCTNTRNVFGIKIED